MTSVARRNAADPDLTRARMEKSRRASLVLTEKAARRETGRGIHAVLLDEMGDDLCLLAVNPAGERGEEQLEREEVRHQM